MDYSVSYDDIEKSEEAGELVVSIAGQEVVTLTHNMAHYDEGVAACLANQYGNESFLKKYCRDNKLYLGIGGGDFDEHSREGGAFKKKDECCTTLMAKALGVDKCPELRKIIRFTQINDRKGSQHPRDIATVLNHLHRQNNDPEDQVENINWAMQGTMVKLYDWQSGDYTIERIAKVAKKLIADKKITIEDIDPAVWLKKGEDAIRLHQIYFEDAIIEFKEKNALGQVRAIKIKSNGTAMPIVAVKSDNYRMGAALRSAKGISAAVVIQKSLKEKICSPEYRGHLISISTNRQYGLQLEETAAIIRYEEQAKKEEMITDDWHYLRLEGNVTGAEEWYYDTDMQMLFNGSLTHPEVPSTRLSLDTLFYYVQVGIDGKRFHPVYKKECLRGKCSGSKRCAYYSWGLQRCRDNRRTNHQTA